MYFNINIDQLVNESTENHDKSANTADILAKLIYAHGNPPLAVISEKIGVAKSILSKILNNKVKNPHPRTLQQIASYFNISIAQLTGTVAISKPQTRILKTQTLAVIEMLNVLDFKRNITGNNPIKYANVTLDMAFNGGFLLRISDDAYFSEFISPCCLVISNNLPTTNKCFVLAKNGRVCTIFKYSKTADQITLQEISSIKTLQLSQRDFENVFMGTVTQTIFGNVD